MNRLFHLLLFCLPMFAMTSCSRDFLEILPSEPDLSEGLIIFDIGFEDVEIDTRATTTLNFNTAWRGGDEIGLFAVKRSRGETKSLSSDPASNYINNVKLTYRGDTGDWVSSEPLWFPAGDDVLDFYAYYPYNPSYTDPTSIRFAIKMDQNLFTDGKLNYDFSDLMAARSNNSGSGWGRGSRVTLTFEHMLTLLEIEVLPKSGTTPSNLSVELESSYDSALLNLTGTSGPSVRGSGDRSTINMYRLTEPNRYLFRAVVPPQTISAGSRLFTVTMNGQEYASETLAGRVVLGSGKVIRYKDGVIDNDRGIRSAQDLIAFSSEWNTASEKSDSLERRIAQEAVISKWSNNGDKNGSVQLRADIDMINVANFTPISSSFDASFWGIFDGNRYKISNLKVNRGDANNTAGLFGFISESAHITGVILENCEIRGRLCIGGIAGSNRGGTISDCTVTGGNLYAVQGYVGSIVGGDYKSGSMISNCIVDNCIVQGPDRVGGIAGFTYGTISDCRVSESKVSAIYKERTERKEYVGGIVGSNCESVIGCSVINSEIRGQLEAIGGIAGGSTTSSIINCSVSGGKVEGVGLSIDLRAKYVGGIVGYNSRSDILYCRVNSVNITLKNPAGGLIEQDDTGGIAGHNYYGKISECRVDGAKIIAGSCTGGIVGESQGDIKGGFMIKNCYVSATTLQSGSKGGGIVGRNLRTHIYGCEVLNCTVTVSSSYSGGIVGTNGQELAFVEGGQIEGCNVVNTTVYTDPMYAGGIAGYTNTGIFGCTVKGGSVTARIRRAGGISGESFITSVCLVDGVSVTAGDMAGGLVGYYHLRARSCISAPASVSANSNRGAIMGYLDYPLTDAFVYWKPLGTLSYYGGKSDWFVFFPVSWPEIPITDGKPTAGFFTSPISSAISRTHIEELNRKILYANYLTTWRWKPGATSTDYPVPYDSDPLNLDLKNIPQ